MASRQVWKVFVGNLSWSTSKDVLREHFTQFGSVKKAKVLFDMEKGISKGFGFVEFNSKSAYNSVLNTSEHHLEGSKLVVKPVHRRSRNSLSHQAGAQNAAQSTESR